MLLLKNAILKKSPQLKADITAKISADPNKTIDTAKIDAMAQ